MRLILKSLKPTVVVNISFILVFYTSVSYVIGKFGVPYHGHIVVSDAVLSDDFFHIIQDGCEIF